MATEKADAEVDLDKLYPDEPDDEVLGPDEASQLFHDDDIIGKENPQVEAEYRQDLKEDPSSPERQMVLAYYLLSRMEFVEAKKIIDKGILTLEHDLDFCDKFCVPLANLCLTLADTETAEKLLMAVPESVRAETPGWKALVRQLWCFQGKLSTKQQRQHELPPLLLDRDRYNRAWKH